MKFFFLLVFFCFSACAGVTGTGNPCVDQDCLEATGQGVPIYHNSDFGISLRLYSWSANELGVSSEAALSGGATEQVLTVQLSDGSTQTMTVQARKLNTSGNLPVLLVQLYPDVQQHVYSGTYEQGYWLIDPVGSERVYFFLAAQTLVSMRVRVLDEDEVYEAVISTLYTAPH